MNPQLNMIHADHIQRQIRETATTAARAGSASPQRRNPAVDLVVRLAGPGDFASLQRLSELEGIPVPVGDTLIAYSGDRALAALPVGSGPALADPFRPTAVAVAELREARAHLRGERPSRGRRIGAALGRLFSPTPSTGASSPVVPGGEGQLIR